MIGCACAVTVMVAGKWRGASSPTLEASMKGPAPPTGAGPVHVRLIDDGLSFA